MARGRTRRERNVYGPGLHPCLAQVKLAPALSIHCPAGKKVVMCLISLRSVPYIVVIFIAMKKYIKVALATKKMKGLQVGRQCQ